MSSPRVFLVRHGETEWSLHGQHTGNADIPLTEHGERTMYAAEIRTGSYVSPRTRAQRTFELLNLNITGPLPWKAHGTPACQGLTCDAGIEVAENIREWDYGDYEALTRLEVEELRASQHHQGFWEIWRDGCPGGENPKQVTDRVDQLIAEIRSKWHKGFSQGNTPRTPSDVLIVAHAHILAAFAMRWAGAKLGEAPAFLFEPGGVGVVSYEHHDMEQPAILVGGGFIADIAEKSLK